MTEKRRLFDLAEYLPGLADSAAGRRILELLDRVLGYERVRALIGDLERRSAAGAPAFEAFLELATVEPDAAGVVASIPRQGGVVVTCNHPFGGLDAVVASALALRARDDTLVVANAEVCGITPVARHLIPLEIMGRPGEERHNIASLRRALDHLRAGGALVVFPAGAVARWQSGLGRVDELPWSPHISRLILKAQVPVLPLRFFGGNPAWFHLLGAIHPLVRSALIPRVFLSQKGLRVRCRTGKLLTADEFPADPMALTGLMRARLGEVSESGGN